MGWLSKFLDSFRDPDGSAVGDAEQIADVNAVIETLRPLLMADGGDIRVLSVKDGWVEVRLRGACTHCPASSTTVRGAIEPRLRERCSWFRGIRAV